MPETFVTSDLWNTVKSELEQLFPRDVHETWFSPVVCLEQGDSSLTLGAPNDFAAIWLNDNYREMIAQKCAARAGRDIDVSIIAEGGSNPATPNNRVAEQTTAAGRSFAQRPEIRRAAPQKASRDRPKVIPRNIFSNFIVGPSNQFAHAASLAVANSPGNSYNPLFLYGDTGLGKTHLMHAIASHIYETNPSSRIVYLSCEKFTNHFMRAIQENTLRNFRRNYRKVDVLLIDDIHFLAGKERTQEEFFHTFNELFESQKQICLTSDRPASEIAQLESRLVSRFQWGMVTDIHAPDLETRYAILEKKARALKYSLKPDVIQFLAEHITRNVRRMEGALIRVGSYSSLIKKELDVATAEGLIQDMLQEEAQKQVTIEKIQKIVAEHYDLRISDMLSKRRPNHIAFPRQVAMYLSRLHTNHPLKEIGEAFGGRDHGTVIHACRAVENMMEQDADTRRAVEYIAKLIHQR